MEVQSVIIKKTMGRAKANKWIREHGFKIGRVDITKTLFRFRQQEPNTFDQKSFRFKDVEKKQIRFVVGKKLKKKSKQ
tara:strand:+ start:69 stop:302 length:234 start_codon:yes stop_codon:yes gene_type:complete